MSREEGSQDEEEIKGEVANQYESRFSTGQERNRAIASIVSRAGQGRAIEET
jgi:hypothetical protein